MNSIRKLPSYCFVRLACVKHAASVHPEPGSNSQIKVCFPVNLNSLANFNRSTVCFGFCSETSFLRIFRVLNTVQSFIFKVQFVALCCFLHQQQLVYHIILCEVCQQLFSTFLNLFSGLLQFQIFGKAATLILQSVSPLSLRNSDILPRLEAFVNIFV